MEYTKGKWKIMEKSPLFYDIGNGSDRTALVPVIVLNAEANACLIAAAPDMYEALKAFEEYSMTNYPANIRLKQIAMEKLDSALAKAEGK